MKTGFWNTLGNRPATISNFSGIICSALTLNAGDCNKITTDVILSSIFSTITVHIIDKNHHGKLTSTISSTFTLFPHIFVKYTLLRNLGNDVMMFVKLKLFGKYLLLFYVYNHITYEIFYEVLSFSMLCAECSYSVCIYPIETRAYVDKINQGNLLLICCCYKHLFIYFLLGTEKSSDFLIVNPTDLPNLFYMSFWDKDYF